VAGEAQMSPFGFVIGKCIWYPVSPKAALVFLLYFYGINPEVDTTVYQTVETQQIVKFYGSPDAELSANAEIRWLDECMLEAYK
jgi:hypothetical protein